MLSTTHNEEVDDFSIFLKISEAIATISERESLYTLIFSELKKVFLFEIAGISTLDNQQNYMEMYIAGIFTPTDFVRPPMKRAKTPILGSPFASVLKTLQPTRLSVDDLIATASQADDVEAIKTLKILAIGELLITPLQTSGTVIGFLLLGTHDRQAIPDHRLPFLQKIVNQVALSVKLNIAYDQVVQREHIKKILLNMNNSLASLKDRDQLFYHFANEINKIFSLNYLGLSVITSQKEEPITVCYVKGDDHSFVPFPVTQNLDIPILTLKAHLKNNTHNATVDFSKDEFSLLCRQSAHFRVLREKHHVTNLLFTSVEPSNSYEINFLISKTDALGFYDWELQFISQLVPQFSFILKNYLAFEEISFLKKQLEQEKTLLLEEINLTDSFHEIIGNSPAIQSVLYQIKQVAPLNSTVLIQGETGTGKELIARAIHNLSDRRDKALVKLNCAALPAQLIESELFGHEKGSFTGAIERRIGKFELANGGTIFLDEIGEMPLELQAKLLRVLQENEFERIGGKSVIRTNIRVVAATNRQLEKEVEAGRFRSDLYFRLNVFPVHVPPLRQRIEDIPLFVKYFMEKYSKRIGKDVRSIKRSTLETLMRSSWPGNIRELEHTIERAVIISKGQVLEIEGMVETQPETTATIQQAIKPLVEVEREHIVLALKAANGKVTGDNGAATLLGLNGKTLGSRMRKLGIRREINFL